MIRNAVLAATVALACIVAAPSGAFVAMSLPADWPSDEPTSAPACEAGTVADLDQLIARSGIAKDKVLRLSGADAAAYLDAVRELYSVELADSDLLVIVEVGDGEQTVEIVFGFKGGCLTFRVEARADAHARVMRWVEQHRS